jgi:NTE family protein
MTGDFAPAAAFAQVAAFARLSAPALAALRDAAVLEQVKGGDYLVREGEIADTLYLVATGRFCVQLPDGRPLAEIEAGEPIGELAFFSGVPRTADVRAMRDSTVLALTRQAYSQVSDIHREITDGILAEVARRLARNTRAMGAVLGTMAAKPGRVIALLPAGGTALPPGFAERLMAALARYEAPRQVRLVRHTDLPGDVDVDGDGFGRWVAGLESSAGRVLLCSGDDAGWNHAIARNADDLLLIAPIRGAADTGQSPLEAYALPRFLPANRTLLLWREREIEAISGSGKWLEGRNVKLHHQLALDNDIGFGRVARFMTGRANGVVLAGGGALGCAHIGVMQALIENGVPIDFYGGTSAGAAMGGALARGLSADETLAQMQEMFIDRKAMKRMTIPVHSFLDPRVFDAELRMRYGDQDIADLPFNFFAVSTNLSTNRVYVHRRGALWEAVRASGSLPTILPPFITGDGDILVDGGVLDNIPVEIMRAAKAGPNVVVALRTDIGAHWRIGATYADVRSTGQLLRDIIMRRKPKDRFPSLIEVMSRSMVVSSEGSVEGALAQADALLIPPIPDDMQILDWHRGREVAEAARRFTAEAIANRADLAAMKAG